MSPEPRQTGVPHRWRHIQASIRDTTILLGEFRAPVLWFSIAVIGGGTLYDAIARLAGEPLDSLIESIYTIMIATFLQPANREFPHHPALQLFHFVMPLVGVIVLAQGLADFGALLFNRKARSKEWEMAVASTMNRHVILVGLGHLGYRVALILHELGGNVVVIEMNPNADTVNAARALGIPVIHDDATRPAVLDGVQVGKARTIILASQNDAVNLQIALKARKANPAIQVVLRIFDDDFAHALQEQFGFIALSATEMAAPVFAAAAAGVDVTNPISVEGQLLSLARLEISDRARFVDQTVGSVEDRYNLSIVLLRHARASEMHPTDSRILAAGDVVAVLGGPDQLKVFLHDNGE